MKKTFIALLALCGTAMSDNYTWGGSENGERNVSANWDLNNLYYPQSGRDNAIIGDNKVNWSNDLAFGFNKDFTMDYGTFTADSYGQFNVTTEQALWYNGHTVTLTGTLDFAGISYGEGTIALFPLNGEVSQFAVDHRGLQVINTNDYVTYKIRQENNGVYIITCNVIPEPTTAALPLLALAGLAVRHRRK